MRNAVILDNVGKKFYRYHSDRPWTFREVFIQGIRRMRAIETFWGLRDISLKISKGEIIGIIGRNGTGKSTLLRLIGGILRPDTGTIKTVGRIGGFLDLEAGLMPDLTGRENIFIGGVISGLTRFQIKKRFDSIVAFSEIEKFIDSPMRMYSDGMKMRLAFAIAAHTDPEILLIDEVLAVGDAAFQQKCFMRINQFKEDGCTIIIVTHYPEQIKYICNKVVMLRSGRIAAYSKPNEVINKYSNEIFKY